MTEEEKEILEATKEFAEIHDIPYDDRIELMILNAMREVVKNCSIPVVVGRSEQFFLFYKELQKAGRLYNDNLSDDIMKREAEWFVKKK